MVNFRRSIVMSGVKAVSLRAEKRKGNTKAKEKRSLVQRRLIRDTTKLNRRQLL